MSENQKKIELCNEVFQLEPGYTKFRVFSFNIQHNRKTNHHVQYEFSVDQTETGVQHKIFCFVFSDQNLLNWFLENLTISTSSLLMTRLKDFSYHVESIYDKKEFKIKGNTTLHFVLVNWYPLTITKNVKLRIIEEWEEFTETKENKLLSTVPPYDKSLLEYSQKMIGSATESLKIITPYIDMSLISPLLQKFDESIDVKIITRTRNEFAGKSSKEAYDHVKSKLDRNHKNNGLIHSRIIIKDDTEVLVSSADLTQDSLLSQFNAGIVSSESKIVSKLSEYFQTVWNLSN